MSYQPIPKEDIWTIADTLASGQPVTLEFAEKAMATLKDHRMELRMRPPDLAAGRRKGATKPQLELWEVFDNNIVTDGIKKIIACSGANQSSKSDGVGVCFCKYLRDHALNGEVFWVVAQSYPTLKDIPLKIMYEFLPESMFPENRRKYDPGIHEVPTLVLTLPGGRGTCEVWFRSEDQGLIKFESARLKGIWWTECGDQAIYEALMPRLLAKGGFMLMDFVPFYGWHRTMLKEKASQPNSPIWYKKFVVMDNAHNLADGAIERMKSTMSDRMWQIRGLGKEAAAQGVVYQNFDPDEHCVDSFRIPDWYPLYMAADWGFNAPHSFGLFTVSPNETIYLIAEHYEAQMGVFETVQAVWEMVSSVRKLKLYPGCPTSVEMFKQMRDVDFKRQIVVEEDYTRLVKDTPFNPIREHVRNEFDRVLASPCNIDNQIYQRHGGNLTLAQEFINAGLPIRPANKRSVDATVEMVRRMFDAGRLRFFKTCHHIREDHVAWSYKSGPDMTVADVDKYENQYSHGCDTVRYAVLMNPTFANQMEAMSA